MGRTHAAPLRGAGHAARARDAVRLFHRPVRRGLPRGARRLPRRRPRARPEPMYRGGRRSGAAHCGRLRPLARRAPTRNGRGGSGVTDSTEIERKPRDDEADVYGMTHVGRVRDSNQDHFLICSLHKQLVIHQTSLQDVSALGATADRAAFVAMVADGAGGGAAGEHASRLAVEAVTKYVADSVTCYYIAADDESFAQSLHDAAMRCHERLMAISEAEW